MLTVDRLSLQLQNESLDGLPVNWLLHRPSALAGRFDPGVGAEAAGGVEAGQAVLASKECKIRGVKQNLPGAFKHDVKKHD